jgi:hypothetical protein
MTIKTRRPMSHPVTFVLGLLTWLSAVAPGSLAGQETRADSLEARVQRLEAVVDSLLRVLGGQADEATAADELEALREAARAAAAETSEPSEDAPSRTGSLSILNPEISVTGDVVGAWLTPRDGGSEATAIPREFELSFQAALDPYTRTKIFFSREEELPIAGLDEVLSFGEGKGAEEDEHGSGVDLEEAYVTWVGLPQAFGLKAGRFRQELGLYNRTHTHALLEIDRPLASVAFLGDDGLIQTGVSLALPSVQTGAGTQSLTLQAAAASNALFQGGTGFSYLGRFQSFWDLSPSTYVQFGVNGVTGRNDDLDLSSELLGVDVSFRWAPPSQARYRELTLRGEWYWTRRDILDERRSGNGGYGQASMRWSQRWITGVRADWLDGFGEGPTAFQFVPSVSWWQSEWVRLRLQYNLLKRAGFDADHTFLLQTVWAVGPHRHEAY